MAGFITGKHLILNAAEILSGFGPRVYLRCVTAVILRRRATFLSLAFA